MSAIPQEKTVRTPRYGTLLPTNLYQLSDYTNRAEPDGITIPYQLNGVDLWMPKMPTFCFYRPYDNDQLTSARKIVLLSDILFPNERIVDSRRLPSVERFVKRYEQKLGKIEFVEEQHDGVFIQAFVGDYSSMTMGCGNKGKVLLLSYLFNNGMALLPRLDRSASLKQFSRTGQDNLMTNGTIDVIHGKHVILEDMMCQE